ncbi:MULTISPECIES: class Ib ribonucleoside-diphosphate reductase assembly flavoprotein NrdI [Bacillus cereus group]|uniref:class Ib ribonucleoside-diphosphate reductase assembly flavoprotein NrdI n=1 Tax=Bacillus cereus group TaxID=86661 RepID=UPI000BFA4C24|nr:MULTISPECIES: class Ib ribonucleoside-diphosphate reductase assembly flavoprotein NrdI [Bacillus cereus group]PGA25378.1 class Ib ribonucleoside-diphosphate reductase assembly flavoprotein NrdI [Bacillus thuringiensis]PGU82107.1 class Ib ribonucleoside-diphosphate reductase assembly flavoprotein NrdI [Bacillus cereus]
MITIAYASLTNNVKNFVERLQEELPESKVIKIDKDTVINEKFVFITYTTGFGQVPKEVASMLKKNRENIVAVAGSGNRNWGLDNFCRAADIISQHYNVPLLHKFEVRGLKSDVDIVATEIKKGMKRYWQNILN